jgi:hypothetical protein
LQDLKAVLDLYLEQNIFQVVEEVLIHQVDHLRELKEQEELVVVEMVVDVGKILVEQVQLILEAVAVEELQV